MARFTDGEGLRHEMEENGNWYPLSSVEGKSWRRKARRTPTGGDGLNLYAYCRNNPVCYVDPSGHMICPEAREQMCRAIAAGQDIGRMDTTIANQLRKWYKFKNDHDLLTSGERYLARQIGLDKDGSEPDVTTGYGYDAGDNPVRIDGE